MQTILDYIEGYATRYREWSDPVGNPGIATWVEPKSFVRGNKPIRADCEHQSEYTFATTADGTLWVGQDDLGVKFRAAITAVEGEDLLRRLRDRFDRGVVKCSVGYLVHEEKCDGPDRSIVRSFSIDHLTLTTTPAFAGTLAWLASTPDEFTPPHLQALRRQFHFVPPPTAPHPAQSARPAAAQQAASSPRPAESTMRSPAEVAALLARVHAGLPALRRLRER